MSFPYLADKVSPTDVWPPLLDVSQHELHAQALCHHLFRTRSIDVTTDHGVVILQGQVQSFYEKQLAQEVVRRLDGVHRVENRIEVAYS